MPRPTPDTASSFLDLVETVARLRRDCPWDREQTSKSIMPFLIEETYEVLEALESEKPEEVRGELGDLLLQILLHAEMAAERGEFDIRVVMDTVREKMVRRHPHVFAGLEVAGTQEVLGNWSRIKAEERRGKQLGASVVAGGPLSLAAPPRAAPLGRKAARAGFDLRKPPEGLAKGHEEGAEVRGATA